MNEWEAAARQKKVAALSSWIVATMSKMRGLTPIEAADAAVRFCDNANPRAWETAAAECGVRTPSETSIAQIRAQLIAQRDAMAAAPDDVFSGFPS